MITLPNKSYTATSVTLEQILCSTTKENMLKVCKKFDLYVSPNLRKDETARRLAVELIDNPLEILTRLSKTELQLLDEIMQGDDTTYVVRKQRKTPYILQKYYLVLTYCDPADQTWHLLMPSALRQSLSTNYKFFLDLAIQGKKAPTAKDLRLMMALRDMLGQQ